MIFLKQCSVHINRILNEGAIKIVISGMCVGFTNYFPELFFDFSFQDSRLNLAWQPSFACILSKFLHCFMAY